MISKADCDKLWSLIKGIKVGMLVTQGDDLLHARPMHLVQDSFEGTIWFYSSDQSGKIDEIHHGRDVCLTFEDHGNETYVSLTGTSEITRDRAIIDRYWNPFISAYFPGGKDDPALCLLKIDMNAAEYWDTTSSRMVQLFKFAKANITREPPHMGDHRKLG